MGRPKSYDDDLRVRLVEAAAQLLADEGLAAVTTRRVATAVGTSTSAIYSLIGSKDDLLREMQREGFLRLARHLDAVEPGDDPLVDLARLGEAYHAMAVESPNLYRVMFGSTPTGVFLEGDDSAFARSTLQVLIDAIARAIDAGVLVGDADDLAVQCWALNHGITSLGLSGMLGTEEQVRHHLEAAARALYDGHAPRPVGS